MRPSVASELVFGVRLLPINRLWTTNSRRPLLWSSVVLGCSRIRKGILHGGLHLERGFRPRGLPWRRPHPSRTPRRRRPPPWSRHLRRMPSPRSKPPPRRRTPPTRRYPRRRGFFLGWGLVLGGLLLGGSLFILLLLVCGPLPPLFQRRRKGPPLFSTSLLAEKTWLALPPLFQTRRKGSLS